MQNDPISVDRLLCLKGRYRTSMTYIFEPLHTLIVFAHLLIIISLSVRIVMARLQVGTALAWLIVVAFLPLAGAALYLIFGEKRLGKKRAAHALVLKRRYERLLKTLPREILVDRDSLSPEADALNRLAETTIGIPAMSGNRCELIDASAPILDAIIADIDRAETFCHMEFYIWNEGGHADDVCEALLRASGRGVRCRILLDAVGSARFLKSDMLQRLRTGGIRVTAALPVGPIRMFFIRLDLRLHRKIVVIDDKVAYTGSFNLVDPRFFKQDAEVGEWIDAMVRIEGPVVHALNALFLWDWEIETNRQLNHLPPVNHFTADSLAGSASVQVVPSGPGIVRESVYQLLLMAIYSAQHELILTTPYFVPDEAVSTAILSAARRGVHVSLILPKQNDSHLVHYTCRSFFDDLLAAGVHIYRFKKGLLHTKSILVDREVALFGTMNLDIRSFWLDFEVTLCIYDPDFGKRLLALQQKYMGQSERLDPEAWYRRPPGERFLENLARLTSPLL